MQKSIEGDLNYGLVLFEGIALPRRIIVRLTDIEGLPSKRSPTVTLTFEILEGRVMCTSLIALAADEHRDISAAFLGSLNLDALKIEALESLAAERKTNDSDTYKPASRQRGRAVARKLADGANQIRRKELLLIGFHYSNPVNRRQPTKAVMLNMGYGSRATAIRRVNDARAKGWVLPVEANDSQIDAHFEEIKRIMSNENA